MIAFSLFGSVSFLRNVEFSLDRKFAWPTFGQVVLFVSWWWCLAPGSESGIR